MGKREPGFIYGGLFENVHPPSQCKGGVCFVHSPTEHHMRGWPVVFRQDRFLWERTCPHGVGHPDPDQLPYWRESGQDGKAVHGCDGCCRPPEGASHGA